MRIRLLIIILLWPVWVSACEVVDDDGYRIKLTTPAHRIISLAPDLTELLFAAGAGQSVIGVIRGSDYPPAAKQIPLVANYLGVDSEKTAALEPDLIVVWSASHFAEPLKKLGVPIYHSHPRKLSDVPRTIQNLGCLAGTDIIAKKAARDFMQQYTQLKKKYSSKHPVTVFYQVWSQPLMTVASDSWINDAITLCGGNNVFKNLHGAAPEINMEAVLAANPQIIISSQHDLGWQDNWRKWSVLSAVKANHLVSINPDLLERASPRLLAGTAIMCQEIDKACRRLS